jgi:hypothetical protein
MVDTETAYYVVEVGAVHFVVLDTVNPGGFGAGSIGAVQLSWLEEQLITRSSRFLGADGSQQTTANPDRLIVVVSHHGVGQMDNPFPGTDPADQRFRGPQLEAMLQRFPNVVLHIAGHSLRNAINLRSPPGGSGYWEITTGSSLEAPMQGRLIEIIDNRDGTLSVFSTVYDSAAPLNPGDAEDPTPDDGINQRLLAAVARQLAMADGQRDSDAGGLAASDRNAELLAPAPFDMATLPTPERPDDLP